jgi:hypothetical protein
MEELVGRGNDVPFTLRLAQTIVWCAARADPTDPRDSLRDERLRPRVLEADRESAVNALAGNRAWRVQGARPVATADDLAGGRLLVYFPDDDLSDGAAEAETRGFFDVNNAPPWATWVGIFRDEENGGSDYLISWVPASLVDIVERGIAVNPEECIRWPGEADHWRGVVNVVRPTLLAPRRPARQLRASARHSIAVSGGLEPKTIVRRGRGTAICKAANQAALG